jgi:hypothetical protein
MPAACLPVIPRAIWKPLLGSIVTWKNRSRRGSTPARLILPPGIDDGLRGVGFIAAARRGLHRRCAAWASSPLRGVGFIAAAVESDRWDAAWTAIEM